MSRPLKKGLDYFPLDTNLLQDIKIKKMLLNCEGGKGVSVYIYLLSRIYKEWYFIEWNEDWCFTISYDLQLSQEFVQKCVEFMVSIGLFDKDLYINKNILTSHGIQEQYFLIFRLNKRKRPSSLPYLLIELTPEETEFTQEETKFTQEEGKQNKINKNKVKHSSSADIRTRVGKDTGALVVEEQSDAADEVDDEDEAKRTTMLAAKVDAEINALLTDAEWKKQVFERFKFLNYDEKALQDILLRWAGEVKMRSRGHTDLTDAKDHVKNWLIIQDKFNQNTYRNGNDNNNGYRTNEGIYAGAENIIRKLRSEGTAKYTTPLPEV